MSRRDRYYQPEGRSTLLGRADCPVLRRWTFLRTPWFACRVHHFLPGGAVETDPHDHRWWFVTLILRGGYDDFVPCALCGGSGNDGGPLSKLLPWCFDCGKSGVVLGDRMRPGVVRFRPALHCHITRVLPEGAWTLVLTGKPTPSPFTAVVHVPCCPTHGFDPLAASCCFACGGPVEQVAMVAAEREPHLVEVVPVERYCARRGCTTSLRGMRDDAEHCSDACRVAAHRHRKALRSRNRRSSRPGGRQVSFGVLVRLLAKLMVQGRVVVDGMPVFSGAEARARAEELLAEALPARQRKPRAHARGTSR
jgi:hypothetical protein